LLLLQLCCWWLEGKQQVLVQAQQKTTPSLLTPGWALQSVPQPPWPCPAARASPGVLQPSLLLLAVTTCWWLLLKLLGQQQ
jgi:hypothetical protein